MTDARTRYPPTVTRSRHRSGTARGYARNQEDDANRHRVWSQSSSSSGLPTVSSLLSGSAKEAPRECASDASCIPNAQQVKSFETQQQATCPA